MSARFQNLAQPQTRTCFLQILEKLYDDCYDNKNASSKVMQTVSIIISGLLHNMPYFIDNYVSNEVLRVLHYVYIMSFSATENKTNIFRVFSDARRSIQLNWLILLITLKMGNFVNSTKLSCVCLWLWVYNISNTKGDILEISSRNIK